jgi:LPXTG-site transpeptidase (sortase) family protein
MRLTRPRARLLALVVFAAAVALIAFLASGLLVPKPVAGPVPLSATPSPVPSGSAVGNLPLDIPPGAGQTPAAASGSTVARRIVYSSLGIDLPIYEGDGVTAALARAAHFPGTGWPGGGTLIYLYGHARTGSFLALWQAQVGDVIELELADGGRARYAVSRVMREVTWNDLSWIEPTPNEVLRLQTCTSYGKTAPRFIVEARPLSAG